MNPSLLVLIFAAVYSVTCTIDGGTEDALSVTTITWPAESTSSTSLSPSPPLTANGTENASVAPTPVTPAFADDDGVAFRHRCPSEWHEIIWWNETRGGVIAVRHCPPGYLGNTYRLCFYGGAWGEVDASECRIAQVIKLKHLVNYHVHKNETDAFPSLAEDLLTTLTNYQPHSLDDILESLDIITILLGARLRINLRIAAHIRFIQTLLEICDRLFAYEEKGWSRPANLLEEVSLKIVKVLHSLNGLGVMVADGMKRGGVKGFRVDNFSHIGITAKVTDSKQDCIFNHLNGNGTRDEEEGDVIVVPSSPAGHRWTGATLRHVIVVLWYRGFRHRLGDSETIVDSAVLSPSVHPGHNPRAPITFILRTRQKWDTAVFRVECSSLMKSNNRSNLWSSAGCLTVQVEKRQVICHCQHASNVAVVMRRIHIPKSRRPVEPINAIVVLGCCLSLLSLVSTMVAHAHLLKSDAEESTLILFNLVISMATTQIVFLAGIQATENKELCAGVSIVLHYLHLVASFWMLAHGIHLYVVVRRPPGDKPPRHLRDYCLLAWVVPVILVVTTFIVNPRGYETRRYCWLSIERGMLLSFIVPVSALILVNTTLMVLVLKNFFEMRAVTRKPDIDRTRIALRMGVVLLPLFGVNWFLGVLALEDTSTAIFEGAFAFTNSMQGFFIFFLNCIVNVEIRHSLRTKWCCLHKNHKSLDLRLHRTRRDKWKRDAQPLLLADNESTVLAISPVLPIEQLTA